MSTKLPYAMILEREGLLTEHTPDKAQKLPFR